MLASIKVLESKANYIFNLNMSTTPNPFLPANLEFKPKKFSCSYPGCHKRFSRKYSLKSRTYSKQLGMDYRCSECNKMFSDR